jgi:hypothetical protein
MAMRRLSETDNVGYAQISADGKMVLYGSFEPDGLRALWIRRVEDRNALLLVSEQKQFWGGLALSPDGGQAFYLTAELTGTHGTLYRISTIGGPPRKLVEVANDVGGISPDGERILLVRYGEPAQIISVKAADGSDEQAILSGISQGLTYSNFRDPQYSSDGKAVYFIRNLTTAGVEEWSVEEIRLDNGSTRRLYSQSQRTSELPVLPGSKGLLMTAVDPVSNLQQIFQISLADGSKSRVTNDLFFYFGVSIDREANERHSTNLSVNGSLCKTTESERLCGRVSRYAQTSATSALVTTNSAGVDWFKKLDEAQTLQLSASVVHYVSEDALNDKRKSDYLRFAAS